MEMNKKSLFLIAILASTLLLFAPRAQAANKFYFDPNPASGNVGLTASVNVKLDAFTDLNAYQFKFRWDQAILKFDHIDFIWLQTQGATTKSSSVSIIGNEITAAEWFNDPSTAVTSTNQVLANITWQVLAGGECVLNMTENAYWDTNLGEATTTATNGYFFTFEPYVGFSMSPSGPRTGETITFNAGTSKATQMAIADFSADGVVDSTDLGTMGAAWNSFEGDLNYNIATDLNGDGVVDSTDLGIMGAHWNEYGNYITGYQWYIDGVTKGSVVTQTISFASYSKTAHNVTVVVFDSFGYSYAYEKDIKVNRDISIFSIWPSMEDYQGTIETEFIAGKYVVILVRIANIGTITEYSDNAKGDFPSTAQLQLWLVHSDGTEEKIYSTSTNTRIRRYWNYTGGASELTRLYDWAPVVGVSHWKLLDLWGATPETDLMLKANFTDTATGLYPFAGDTDSSNNELTFGPFNITAGFDHDIRLEGVWTNDAVGYYLPIQPYGTNFKYGYGQKFGFGGEGPYDPITPGTIANITVAMSNVGTVDEEVTYHVYAGGIEIYSATETLDVATGYFEFDVPWDTTGFYGTYSITVYVEPVPSETGLWATWDNNLPDQALLYFNAYDDWVVQSSYP
jgi:hypothetical protein